VLSEIDFLLNNFDDRFTCVAFVETSELKTDMCKSESSQTHEVRGRSRLIL